MIKFKDSQIFLSLYEPSCLWRVNKMMHYQISKPISDCLLNITYYYSIIISPSKTPTLKLIQCLSHSSPAKKKHSVSGRLPGLLNSCRLETFVFSKNLDYFLTKKSRYKNQFCGCPTGYNYCHPMDRKRSVRVAPSHGPIQVLTFSGHRKQVLTCFVHSPCSTSEDGH